MDEQPRFQPELPPVMEVQILVLARQRGELVGERTFLLIEKLFQVVQFRDRVAPRIVEVIEIKLADDRGLQRERFGFLPELRAAAGDGLPNHFAAVRGELPGNRARPNPAHDPAHHHGDIQAGQAPIQPTDRNSRVPDKNHRGQQPGPNMKLQPRLRREQRQERQLLARVEQRQREHQRQQQPAGVERGQAAPL